MIATRVAAGGTTLAAFARAPAHPRGPPIVLVHGNSSCSRVWERLVAEPALADRRLVALDLAGHGASERAPAVPGRYGLAWHAATIADALRALDLRDAVLVGHSLGGHVLLEALGRGLVPEARALLVTGAPPVPDVAAMATAFHRTAAMGFLFQADLSAADAACWAALAVGPHVAAPDWLAPAMRATDPDARAALGASLMTTPIADEVAAVRDARIPVAVVHAADDAFVRADAYAALPADRLHGGRVQVVANAGHYAPWEAAAAFARPLAELVADVAGSPI